MEMKDFLKVAASVVPSKRQLEWFDTEFYAFVHFSPNTYTDREWGLGNEDPKIFNPINFDPDQWTSAVKSAGMKGIVITAKHHDGFCLWPSKYTEHSIKNSPYMDGKGDIVGSLADACRRAGLKFGFYLSPWDRNSKYYGTEQYNDYYKAQLTELLTQYGEIFHVWLDGACGEGSNGKKQEYDFDGYIELVRKYQPNATIFYDHGPDVRWCGNESGSPRNAEWAVVPHELTYFAEQQVSFNEPMMNGTLDYMYNTDEVIGSLSNIMYSKGLSFVGSEIDMSIRPGWFYHKNEQPHSLDRLFNTYLTSVGANACLHLNIPPRPDGLFDDKDVVRLKELGDKIKSEFAENLIKYAKVSSSADYPTQPVFDIKFDSPRNVKYVVLKEDIAKGQRVESFVIQLKNEFGSFTSIYNSTCIGHKKICVIPEREYTELRVRITGARDEVFIKDIEIY